MSGDICGSHDGGGGMERMLLLIHSAQDSLTENDPLPQISTVSTGEKLQERARCFGNWKTLCASIYPPAAGLTFTEWASFIFLTAKGCEDNDNRTVLLCTDCVPGTSHASSTHDHLTFLTLPPSFHYSLAHFTDAQIKAPAHNHHR